MKMRSAVLLMAILAVAAGWTQPAVAQTSITAGSGGIFPPGTTFNGVPLNGLQSGYGVEIGADGSALGQFCTVLLGTSVLGGQQTISVEGQATSGSRTGVNLATFSGTATINMGDGTAPLLGVPFTATITTNTNDQGSIGLVLGLASLPSATVNQGTMTIK